MMFTSDFDYRLPDSLIANDPMEPRDECRLMVMDRGSLRISNDVFYHIGDYLKKGDVLVLNNTKVIPCRLEFDVEGRAAEIFVTKFLGDDWALALVKPGKLFREGARVSVVDGVEVVVEEVLSDGQRRLRFEGGLSVSEVIERFGKAPFPPYIKESEAGFDQYQTVYAKDAGSLAAPTAGLHFTDRLLGKLRAKGVEVEYVTLHVGLGTFLPVKVNDVRSHVMHAEEYSLDVSVASRLSRAKSEGRRVIAVGTTAVRVLETSFKSGAFVPGRRDTDIFIYPGYEWKCVDGLVTNFHLPKSTLMMLVSSFAGRDFVMRAYELAIRKRYRFYSFGDAMLIL